MNTPNLIDRQTFLKACGASCVSLLGLPWFITSCKSVYYAQKPVLNGQTIQINRSEFETISPKGEIRLRPFILVELKGQSYPIYLYRRGENDFTALLMKCSHQGNELNAHDGYLTCPAHGSEYDSSGKVTEGPAEKNLTAYRVTTDIKTIFIHIS